jgi:hypothetical protein
MIRGVRLVAVPSCSLQAGVQPDMFNRIVDQLNR